jgi:hypothetical protein
MPVRQPACAACMFFTIASIDGASSSADMALIVRQALEHRASASSFG